MQRNLVRNILFIVTSLLLISASLLAMRMVVRADQNQHLEKFDILGGDIAEFDKKYAHYRRAQVVECTVARSLVQVDPDAVGWADGYPVYLEHVRKYLGQRVKAKITDVRRSYGVGTVVAGTNVAASN